MNVFLLLELVVCGLVPLEGVEVGFGGIYLFVDGSGSVTCFHFAAS